MSLTMDACTLHGLREQDMEYFYQPIYHVGVGAVDKAEVLLRVRNGEGGFFDTEQVVTLAEELGLIDAWDKRTFIHTCKVLPEFHRHGIRQLSVNLSPTACSNPELVPEIRRILAETNTDPSSICIEVTEVAKLINETQFVDAVQELYDLGIHIAIDDFGKGYSNLQRIISIPFHTLKLDKSLVWGMGENSLAEPLVGNMVDFAQRNKISVVAEGIETALQQEKLSDMGCQYLQGYYISPPISQEMLFAFMAVQGAPSALR